MKKIILIFTLIILGFQIQAINATAEDIVYPFDSITIIEAFKFEVQVTTPLSSDSLLYDLVAVDDILTIYVGTLEFVENGVPASGSANVLIVTNEDGEDLVRFLINSYTYYPDVSRSWGFASHILIDPLVGVYKDMTIIGLGIKEMSVFENITAGTWSFFDNKGLEMTALPGTYELETGLSIQISAYTVVEE
jgi:hypothetical protein